jgi:hypothetical protein
MNPPHPKRFLVMGRAEKPPRVDIGMEKVVGYGGDHFLVIVTTQEENGDLHAVGGGKRLRGVWSRVWDSHQGMKLTCWSWTDEHHG